MIWVKKLGVLTLFTSSLYFLASVMLSVIPVNSEWVPASMNTVTIYVVSNGVHTDFIVPSVNSDMDWRSLFSTKYFSGLNTPAPYLMFGWGNREFYMDVPEWSDFNLIIGLKAVLGIGKSAMHVAYLPSVPTIQSGVRKIQLTSSEYQKLVYYIQHSFEWSAHQTLIHIPNSGYYGVDAFFEAKGHYHLFKTCNVWTGEGLKFAGIRTSLWSPWTFGILFHL